MANTFETPNMHMDLPVVQGEVGPLWAQELNTAIGTVIDAHDHTSGNGVQVPTAGLNIDADLNMNVHGFDNVRDVALTAITQPGAGTAVATIYRTGSDLYYQDGSGNNIRLTEGGIPAAGGVDANYGIHGDYAGTPAHLSYYNATATYEFYQNAGETLRASGVFAQLQSVQATQNDFYLATGGGYTGGTATLPTGGWRQRATDDTFALSGAAAASPTYGLAVGVDPLSGGLSGDYSLSVNGVSAQFPLSLTRGANSGILIGMQASQIRWAGGGVAPVGLGHYHSTIETAESKLMSRIYTYYAAKTTSSNGAAVVALSPTFNGVEYASGGNPVGISVGRFSSTNSSASLAAGLLGLPVSGQGVTVYGDLVPDASGGRLGTASLPWLIQGTSGTFSSSVTANGFASTGTSSMQTINAATGSTYGLGNSAQTWLNVWGDNTRSITHILRDANPATKTQTQKYNSIVHWSATIDSGANIVAEFTSNNSISGSISHAANSGIYNITMSTALPSQAAFLVTVADDNANMLSDGYYASVYRVSTTVYDVVVWKGDNTKADKDFTIAILSTGF